MTKNMLSLPYKIKKSFKKLRIQKVDSMEEICIKTCAIPNLEKKVVHEIPSSLIELTKEDKKMLEYLLMRMYLEEHLL